jgi:hypothetical protein
MEVFCMPDYRIYGVLHSGRIKGPSIAVACGSDDEVIEKAVQMLDRGNVEVRDGRRLVRRLISTDNP